jgi:uncharacterized membrane protein YcgQ (UPF0703/DUF1980 family)
MKSSMTPKLKTIVHGALMLMICCFRVSANVVHPATCRHGHVSTFERLHKTLVIIYIVLPLRRGKRGVKNIVHIVHTV